MTTTTVETSDAMTSRELSRHAAQLKARLGKAGDISIMVSESPRESVYIGVYPSGICSREASHAIRGETWAQAISAAYQWIENSQTVRRETLIRTMALAIIDITDQHVVCTDRLLIGRQFSKEEVDSFHLLACARAAEMSGNAPFKVEFPA